MLKSCDVDFDYFSFMKKIKHYFADTSPIYAQVRFRLSEVIISNGEIEVYITIPNTLDVKESVNFVIQKCEDTLYPRMVNVVEQSLDFSEERIKEMLIQGFTLEQIHDRKIKKQYRQFIITRFNNAKNSIDYRDELTDKTFRAHLNRPLITYRSTILTLSKLSQVKQYELYKMITENSRIEELIDA